MKRLFLCLILLIVNRAQAGVIFSQSPDGQGLGANSQYDSSVNASTVPAGFVNSPNVATGYDDFNIAAGATVTGIDWVGQIFTNPSLSNASITDVTGFTLNIYADSGAGNPPVNLLYSQAIAGNGNPTDLGTADINGTEYFSYSATLATPFAAAPGTTYWLSVVADLTGYYSGAQWGWASSGGVSNGLGGFTYDPSMVSWQADQAHGGEIFPQNANLAFDLQSDSSAAVPEPSSGILWTLAVGLLAAFKRWRQF